jgi:tetratricopeptide (TPR) repeat protein
MLLLACTAAALWRTRRQPYLAAGWLWFLGVLVPVIGIVQVGGQAWADRYSYIPHLGLLAALVWLGGDLAGGLRLPRPSRRAAAAALAVLLLVLGGLSARQATFWKDSQTLFQRALDVTQGNYMAHYMLSVYANEQGDDAAFVRHYTAAAALHPRYVADAHVRKGYETAVNGRYQAAMFHFVQALELDPDNARALSNLGMLHAASGRLDDAVALLRRAVEAKPGAEALQENLERLLRLRRERKTHTEAAQ